MPRLLVAEIVRAGARQKAPRDAYTSLMSARAELLREQPYDEGLRRAMTHVEQALSLDPENAEAHAMAAYLLTHQTWSRFSASSIARPMARASVHAGRPPPGLRKRNGADDVLRGRAHLRL